MITWERLRSLVLLSESKHNFRFGVINGVCFSLAETLVDASLVLALFVRELGGSTLLVGLLPSLKNGGFLLPQLLVAGRITGMPRMMPLYRHAASASRSTAVRTTITSTARHRTARRCCQAAAAHRIVIRSTSTAFARQWRPTTDQAGQPALWVRAEQLPTVFAAVLPRRRFPGPLSFDL